jgi:upstream activation factor subunit UAF30
MSPAAGAKKPAAAAAQADAAKPKVGGGISKPVPVSDALRRFAGADEVSRSGAVKLIWAHIKAKGLQVLRRFSSPCQYVTNNKLVG